MLGTHEQQELVTLLTQLYRAIAPIEQEYGLLVGGRDYRPRIDYFHDAIRAFTKGDPKAFEKGGRLTIEYLSYDLKMMRYLQAKPLALLKPAQHSPRTTMTTRDGRTPTDAPRKLEREQREHVAESYQSYAVLFAALLKPFADRNYQARTEEHHTEVEQLAHAAHHAEDNDLRQLADTAQHIGDEDVRKAIQQFLAAESKSKQGKLKDLLAALKAAQARADKEIAAIEGAHLDYVMTQLAVFEDGKDLVKKLMKKGMNLVGKFVDNAMQQAKRESGRNR